LTQYIGDRSTAQINSGLSPGPALVVNHADTRYIIPISEKRDVREKWQPAASRIKHEPNSNLKESTLYKLAERAKKEALQEDFSVGSALVFEVPPELQANSESAQKLLDFSKHYLLVKDRFSDGPESADYGRRYGQHTEGKTRIAGVLATEKKNVDGTTSYLVAAPPEANVNFTKNWVINPNGLPSYDNLSPKYAQAGHGAEEQ
jgi:hypothetical protein